jgi:hypothetical protein
MKQKILFIGLIILLYITFPFSSVYAAKKRVRVNASKSLSYSSVKLSRATNSVILNLLNLSTVSKVSYELSYISTGIPQGVAGSITPSSNSDSRDLYFGTCSKGVCTPHYNIANAQLIVRIYQKNGSIYTKLYRIKV